MISKTWVRFLSFGLLGQRLGISCRALRWLERSVRTQGQMLLHKHKNCQELKNSVLFSGLFGDVMMTNFNNCNAACHGSLRAVMVRSHYTTSLTANAALRSQKFRVLP